MSMNRYDVNVALDEVFKSLKNYEHRLCALEDESRARATKMETTIPMPPLPGHPGFKTFYGRESFLVLDIEIRKDWTFIEFLEGHMLEACCCIARAWWLDESKKVFKRQTQTTNPGLLTPEYQKCESNAQAWADYLKARQIP